MSERFETILRQDCPLDDSYGIAGFPAILKKIFETFVFTKKLKMLIFMSRNRANRLYAAINTINNYTVPRSQTILIL